VSLNIWWQEREVERAFRSVGKAVTVQEMCSLTRLGTITVGLILGRLEQRGTVKSRMEGTPPARRVYWRVDT
jgi:hypothetical protein